MPHPNSRPLPTAPHVPSLSEATTVVATDPAETFPKALTAAARARGRRRRDDGWTSARIRTFLRRLAECGVVEEAARAAGMSRQGAYSLRNSAAGGSSLSPGMRRNMPAGASCARSSAGIRDPCEIIADSLAGAALDLRGGF